MLCGVAWPGCRPVGSPLARVWEALRCGVWRIPWRTWGLLLALIVGVYLRSIAWPQLPPTWGGFALNYFDAQRVLNGELWVFYPTIWAARGCSFT
jgi:hypothetical protein